MVRSIVRLTDRAAIERAAADLAGLFADAELVLRERVAARVARGLEEHPDDVLRAVRLAELRAQTAALVAELQTASTTRVDAVIAAAERGGHAQALRELGLERVTTAAPSTLAAQAITLDLTSAVDDVARRLLRWPDDVYRRAVAGPAAQFVLGARQTSRAAQAAAWQRLIAEGVTGFVDRAGRRWTSASYVEMATRTATRRAWDVQHVDTLRTAGVELVQVVIGQDACQVCARWAGAVLRVDAGPTGFVRMPAVDDAERQVDVHVDGTVDQARDAHWQHPNCRCRLVAYLPGLSSVTDATTYDPEAERERERLRYLERQVRRAKVLEASAVTEDQRRAARAKIRDRQRQIREHVAATGLNRKTYREQVDLGLSA